MDDKLIWSAREIAKTVEARRRELGITQVDLAKSSRISRRTINAFTSERDGPCDIGLSRLLALLSAVGLTMQLVPTPPSLIDGEGLRESFREETA